jgi:hypothetical protein
MAKTASQNKTREFDKFDYALTELLKVRHVEIKAKLDEEKAAKQKKKTNKAKRNDH